MKEIIQVENQFYVLATSSLADDRTRVLKYGETFGVFNRLGDIEGRGLGEQGLYHRGTRHLSRLSLRVGDTVPQLLSSSIHEDGTVHTVDMMNPDVYGDTRLLIPRGSLHVFRSRFLWRGNLYEKIRISNFGLSQLEAAISFHFSADYADIFQVRGMERQAAGAKLAPEVGNAHVTLSYSGLDQQTRSTVLTFDPPPAVLSDDMAAYFLPLAPREEQSLFVRVCCDRQPTEQNAHFTYESAVERSVVELAEKKAGFCSIKSSDPSFDRWMSRSQTDVMMMIRGNPEGDYPYAGVPWFSTVFGRDALITAMQCLWAAPWIAESVLRYLALHQAVEVIPAQEAEPGKILHEMRHGEMANLKEVPFGLYYGSVDSTPLFVLLAGMYFEQTGNRALIETLWPNILAALDWIEQYGDVDGDGFVEYQARAEKGLTHQGWKDSHDAVFHADGVLARAPIALCEVQAYVYGARLLAAKMAASLGQQQLADTQTLRAAELQEKFERQFWDDSLETYVLALDADKKPCRVLTSNAGHVLLTQLASPERARRLVQTLLGENLYCGWGIRTLGSNEVRYNPMAYHNGSVWPHDNSMIAAGLARYGYKDEACRLLSSLLDASMFMELNRLPELFCGFHKRPGAEGPTLYPVACSPQAWSAGAAYLFLNACLGMTLSHHDKTIRFSKPYLPRGVNELHLTGLKVGEASVDLQIGRTDQQIIVQLRHAPDDIHIEVDR